MRNKCLEKFALIISQLFEHNLLITYKNRYFFKNKITTAKNNTG
jgi:hypothetical protein